MDAMHGKLYISCKWQVIVTVSQQPSLLAHLF